MKYEPPITMELVQVRLAGIHILVPTDVIEQWSDYDLRACWVYLNDQAGHRPPPCLAEYVFERDERQFNFWGV